MGVGAEPLDLYDQVSESFVQYYAEQQTGSIPIEPQGCKSKDDVSSVLSSYRDSQVQNLVEVTAAEGHVLIGKDSGALDFEDDDDLDVIDDSFEESEDFDL